MPGKIFCVLVLCWLCYAGCAAQEIPSPLPVFRAATASTINQDTVHQTDLIDVLHKIIPGKKKNAAELAKQASTDSASLKKVVNFSFIPSVGYTLSTGFAADLAGNMAFHTGANHKGNLSELDGDIAYDTKAQRIFVVQSIVWSATNAYKFVSDIRWERFPESTYGLGSSRGSQKENLLDFNYLKVYGTEYKRLVSSYYIGAGYNLDYHYRISAQGNKDGSIADFSSYGMKREERSSGINIAFLYDDRKNSINASDASYANLSFRQSARIFGSQSNWNSLQLDVRRYLKLSPLSENVLAFWSLAWFTAGKVPYLDLPFTGGDVFNNTGRGYTEGRFRGKNMLYLESEYRFGITRNGLVGGVVFANAQSFSEYGTNKFTTIAPAIGTGIRLKINKHSGTNVCIDYGLGIYGSRGIFVNLGEVF